MLDLDLDSLLVLCSYLDDYTLRSLSQVSRSTNEQVNKVVGLEQFWQARIESLIQARVVERTGWSYKKIYPHISMTMSGLDREGCVAEDEYSMLILLESNLLQDKKDSFFEIACSQGYASVVRLLLQDREVDPCRWNDRALQQASIREHTEVASLLLQDIRVDHRVKNDLCFIRPARPARPARPETQDEYEYAHLEPAICLGSNRTQEKSVDEVLTLVGCSLVACVVYYLSSR